MVARKEHQQLKGTLLWEIWLPLRWTLMYVCVFKKMHACSRAESSDGNITIKIVIATELTPHSVLWTAKKIQNLLHIKGRNCGFTKNHPGILQILHVESPIARMAAHQPLPVAPVCRQGLPKGFRNSDSFQQLIYFWDAPPPSNSHPRRWHYTFSRWSHRTFTCAIRWGKNG